MQAYSELYGYDVELAHLSSNVDELERCCGAIMQTGWKVASHKDSSSQQESLWAIYSEFPLYLCQGLLRRYLNNSLDSVTVAHVQGVRLKPLSDSSDSFYAP